MLEKASKPTTSYSFEQLLSWFGHFTPQFKFRLQGLRPQMDATAFDRVIRETLTVFRALIINLAKVNKGADRARRVFELIDGEHRASPPEGVSCSAGCSACCKSFPKQITTDEADLLAELILSGQTEIDADELKRQATADEVAAPCIFLDEDSRCRIYANRPAVCRKYHVTSPASACAIESEAVIPHIDLMPELIVSASLSMPDNGFGSMPKLVVNALSARGIQP